MEPRLWHARRPFPVTPDPVAIRPTSNQRRCGLVLDRAFRDGAAAALIDGEPGTGKTLAGVRFLDSCPPGTCRAMIAAPRHLTAAALLQAILFDLRRPYQGLTEQELRLAVTSELLTAAETAGRLVLFVDEAHNLSADAVEELRLLGNIGSPLGPALFVLLAGLPGVRAAIAANPPFAHRVTARCRLERLTEEESLTFLRDELYACGEPAERRFADDALPLVARLAGGIPRLLSRLAGLAFEIAEEEGAERIDIEAVLTAAAELDLAIPEADSAVCAGPGTTDTDRPTADPPDPLPHPNQVPRPNRPLTTRHQGGAKAKRSQPAAA